MTLIIAIPWLEVDVGNCVLFLALENMATLDTVDYFNDLINVHKGNDVGETNTNCSTFYT